MIALIAEGMFWLHRFSKKILLLVILSMILAINILACTNDKLQEDKIIGQVNGDSITEKEFYGEFEMLKKMYEKQLGEDILKQEAEDGRPYEEVLRDNLLESMILERLINKEMEKLDIKVKDEEIEEEIKSGYIDGLGGQEEYKEFLKENNFTEDFLKNGIRKSIMDKKYRAYFFDKIKFTEKELEEYYDSNKDSLIEIKISMIELETKEEAEEILERLKKGEDFHQMATTKSVDPISAAEGGDMGYLTRANLEHFNELEDIAFSLKEGEMSGLIQGESAYYIILVEDRKEDYHDLKEGIITSLKDEKYIENLSRLKANANIKIYLKDKNKNK